MTQMLPSDYKTLHKYTDSRNTLHHHMLVLIEKNKNKKQKTNPCGHCHNPMLLRELTSSTQN